MQEVSCSMATSWRNSSYKTNVINIKLGLSVQKVHSIQKTCFADKQEVEQSCFFLRGHRWSYHRDVWCYSHHVWPLTSASCRSPQKGLNTLTIVTGFTRWPRALYLFNLSIHHLIDVCHLVGWQILFGSKTALRLVFCCRLGLKPSLSGLDGPVAALQASRWLAADQTGPLWRLIFLVISPPQSFQLRFFSLQKSLRNLAVRRAFKWTYFLLSQHSYLQTAETEIPASALLPPSFPHFLEYRCLRL